MVREPRGAEGTSEAPPSIEPREEEQAQKTKKKFAASSWEMPMSRWKTPTSKSSKRKKMLEEKKSNPRRGSRSKPLRDGITRKEWVKGERDFS
ncbi:hypothetical protein Bca101_091106 [Brassica carinata]